MEQEERFDFLVLGGGSGGVASARRAASYGKKVALIEAGRLGGTCVNVGCVPKKIMWTAASLAGSLRDARAYGFEVPEARLDFAHLKRGRDDYVRFLNDVYRRNLVGEGARLIEGWGKFVAPRVIETNGCRYHGEHVLVATGAAPKIPDVRGRELGITSDGFFELAECPARVAVIGSGYIGVELAGILRALGSEVTLVMRGEAPLRGFDGTLRAALTEDLEMAGIRIVRDAQLEAIEALDGGTRRVAFEDGRSIGPVECVLFAVGRRPSTTGFGLELTGAGTDAAGHVVVDDFQATTAPGVYAVGDVTGRVELTPVAIAAGRRLADRLFGGVPDARLDYGDVPTVVFSRAPIGTVGLSEETAREQYGERVKVYTRRFTSLHYALGSEKPKTTVKLVTLLPDERVLGIHVIGFGADEMIQGFAVALKMGARKADLDRTVAIHPTGAEEIVTLR